MSATSSMMDGSLSPALGRLIDVIEEENALLKDHKIVFHGSFTDRKNQALRELMAVRRQESMAVTASRARPQLLRLQHALQENARLLKIHITAVGEISDIIVGSLREAESDGTYSRSPVGHRT